MDRRLIINQSHNRRKVIQKSKDIAKTGRKDRITINKLLRQTKSVSIIYGFGILSVMELLDTCENYGERICDCGYCCQDG